MSKTLVIAVREYLAAVKTKGFIVGLILMPLLMGGGVAVQAVTKGLEDPTPRKIAVLDRTPDRAVWAALRDAAARRADASGSPQREARYTVEPIEPEQTAGEIEEQQRQRVVAGTRALQFVLNSVDQAAPVRQPGESIVARAVIVLAFGPHCCDQHLVEFEGRRRHCHEIHRRLQQYDVQQRLSR